MDTNEERVSNAIPTHPPTAIYAIDPWLHVSVTIAEMVPFILEPEIAVLFVVAYSCIWRSEFNTRVVSIETN